MDFLYSMADARLRATVGKTVASVSSTLDRDNWAKTTIISFTDGTQISIRAEAFDDELAFLLVNDEPVA